MSQAIFEATMSRPCPAPHLFPDEPDSELIDLCEQVVSLATEEAAVHAKIGDTLEEERHMEPVLEPLLNRLWRRQERVLRQLQRIGGPTSHAGALATARAALALATRNDKGEVFTENDGEWLAFCVVEYLISVS